MSTWANLRASDVGINQNNNVNSLTLWIFFSTVYGGTERTTTFQGHDP